MKDLFVQATSSFTLLLLAWPATIAPAPITWSIYASKSHAGGLRPLTAGCCDHQPLRLAVISVLALSLRKHVLADSLETCSVEQLLDQFSGVNVAYHGVSRPFSV